MTHKLLGFVIPLASFRGGALEDLPEDLKQLRVYIEVMVPTAPLTWQVIPWDAPPAAGVGELNYFPAGSDESIAIGTALRVRTVEAVCEGIVALFKKLDPAKNICGVDRLFYRLGT